MITLTLSELAEAAGGTLVDCESPEALITGPVVADSRQAEAGALFAALPGEHADGHDYARSAVRAGAVGVLASRPCGVPAVVVDDVTAALGRVARRVRDRLPGLTVIGVTGSSGKTGTKDLLAGLLAELGPTVAAVESYNNEIGHPLTVLRADHTTRHLVLELSARGSGHIAALAEIAPPTVGVVLNVGTAHLGEFGTRAAIARAKSELVEALPADGVAVLNADDLYVAQMAGRTNARVVSYGVSRGATVRAQQVRLDERGRSRFTLTTPEGTAPVELRLFGEHQVGNSLAAAAVARELGMPVAAVAGALSRATPVSRWRMDVRDRADGVTVVNDAYNANPESVRAALGAVAAMAGNHRTWAVLGEMAELGDASAEEHRGVGALLDTMGVAGVVTVGPGAEPVAWGVRPAVGTGGRPETVSVSDAEAAVAALRERLRPGDVVLVKGSRVAGLERVASALLESPDGDSWREGGSGPGKVPA